VTGHAFRTLFPVNISKSQQRTLHALAQGGRIVLERDEAGALVAADCLTHTGFVLPDCNLAVFKALKRRRLIMSRNAGPYRVTREGLLCLRSQGDNRVSSRAW
jgi:uncharacterized protein YjhX (UPF0386 family)